MIAQLQARIAEQDAEIAELRRRLAASSRNSSQPPSAEGRTKPAPTSLRGRSGRKPGGQPGREGRTLRQVAVPDEVVVHEPGGCAGCGGGGGGAAAAGGGGPPMTRRAGSSGGRCSTFRRSPCGGRAPAGVPPLCLRRA